MSPRSKKSTSALRLLSWKPVVTIFATEDAVSNFFVGGHDGCFQFMDPSFVSGVTWLNNVLYLVTMYYRNFSCSSALRVKYMIKRLIRRVWWSSVRRNQRLHFSVTQLAVDNGPNVRSTRRNVKQSGEVIRMNASVFCNSCTRQDKRTAIRSNIVAAACSQNRPAVTESTEPETHLCYHDTTRATYTSTNKNGFPRCNTGLAQKIESNCVVRHFTVVPVGLPSRNRY